MTRHLQYDVFTVVLTVEVEIPRWVVEYVREKGVAPESWSTQAITNAIKEKS